MKKVHMIFLASFLLLGCSNNTTKEDDKKPDVVEKEDSDKDKKEEKIKTDEELDKELSELNFSYFEGEYENSKGEVIYLQKDGTRKGFKEESYDKYKDVERISYSSDSAYGWGLSDELGIGFQGTIYPVGVEVYELKTDTSKIRLSFGQDSPIDDADIYYKK